eukprot:335539-Pelagomonas_calceolata.AAC.2
MAVPGCCCKCSSIASGVRILERGSALSSRGWPDMLFALGVSELWFEQQLRYLPSIRDLMDSA